MADKDKDKNKDSDAFATGGDQESDFGALTGGESDLGNLPPLSDFESSAGGGFDSGLPPLSAIDPSSDKDRISIGGLPPISDIPVETPIPTGGAIKPAPAGYGSTPVFGTPSSDSGLDTPSGTGFQDLTADSDFTPETPEVAPPGPGSDIDTPLFDSAFGGGASFSAAADTSAPTQAMETPMFGAEPAGFDADAFGQGTGGFGGGTPVPDFGPDTNAPTTMTPPPSMAPPAPPVKAGKGGGGKSALWIGVAAVVALAVGILAGPRIPGVPNPAKSQVADLEAKNRTLQTQVDKFTKSSDPNAPKLTPEEITRLQAEKDRIDAEIAELTSQRDTASNELTTVQGELETARTDLETTNAEFVQAQAEFDTLVNETAVVRARRDGLAAEGERLEGLVGKLEDADERRTLTKDTLESNIERLEILVSEGSPLAPEKYSRDARLARVADLKARAEAAKWVDPALLDEYTSLYTQELDIAKSREYFFAKIPVSDRFGTNTMSWAECVMNGNWGVYYRTLDGKHLGVYQNVAAQSEPARYAFMDIGDEAAYKRIESEIFASRTPGFEEKLELLAQKQLVVEDQTAWQKSFSSL